MAYQIVVLDGYTVNPGDLSWEGLKRLGRVTIYDRTSPEQVFERAKNADILLTNKTVVNAGLIRKLTQLKYIGVIATGFNIVDIDAANSADIIVTNVSGYGAPSVAQHTFSLLLELTNSVGYYTQSVKEGEWHASQDWSYWKAPIHELAGKRMGIIGLGAIGRKVASLAIAFDMEVVASHTHPERDRMDGVTFLDLDDVFKTSDVISLHCPLTASNAEFVNKRRLALMKPGGLLINTARGQLINHNDLYEALASKTLAGAALDVFTTEPPQSEHPLFSLDQCIITPHQAWAALEARQRLLEGVINNIRAFMSGTPVNVVNKPSFLKEMKKDASPGSIPKVKNSK
ncbi:MAG: D-2-hydroxyacid dehydrogenase [Cyclobacteriaceae bacterium]|nr:D-2-hydroxyacid dehydrogenase [Cyclobacteriaceae bacterium]